MNVWSKINWWGNTCQSLFNKKANKTFKLGQILREFLIRTWVRFIFSTGQNYLHWCRQDSLAFYQFSRSWSLLLQSCKRTWSVKYTPFYNPLYHRVIPGGPTRLGSVIHWKVRHSHHFANLQLLKNVSYCMAYHPLFTSGCFLGIKYLDHYFSWNLDLLILFLLALKFREIWTSLPNRCIFIRKFYHFVPSLRFSKTM